MAMVLMSNSCESHIWYIYDWTWYLVTGYCSLENSSRDFPLSDAWVEWPECGVWGPLSWSRTLVIHCRPWQDPVTDSTALTLHQQTVYSSHQDKIISKYSFPDFFWDRLLYCIVLLEGLILMRETFTILTLFRNMISTFRSFLTPPWHKIRVSNVFVLCQYDHVLPVSQWDSFRVTTISWDTIIDQRQNLLRDHFLLIWFLEDCENTSEWRRSVDMDHGRAGSY